MNSPVIRSITFTINLSKIVDLDYQSLIKNKIQYLNKGFKNKSIGKTLRINIIKINFIKRPDKYLF